MTSNLFTIFEEDLHAQDKTSGAKASSRPRHPEEPQRNCFIDILPDELLFEIFSYLSPTYPTPYQSQYQLARQVETLPLSLVSKKWNFLYGPILFAKIELRSQIERRAQRTGHTLDILNRRPEVRNYVRSISLKLSGDDEDGMVMENLTNVIKMCTMINHIGLSGSLQKSQRLLLNTILSLPYLKSLAMPYTSFYLIDQQLNLPSLERLRLYRLGISPEPPGLYPPSDWSGRGQAVAVDFTHSAPPLEKLDNVLPQHMYKCTLLTALE
jgi:hypothetical protein